MADVMNSWAPAKYKTRSWSSYTASLKRAGRCRSANRQVMPASPKGWFDPEMVWTPPPSGKRGRQQHFSDAAIQACLALKVLLGMSLRQTTGFVRSLLQLVGPDWTAPDFSTLRRRQQTLNVSLPYRSSTGPLNLLIPSRDIALRCACRAVDAPVLPELPDQIPPGQDIGTGPADAAYDTRKCHAAIAARDAHAMIPPRKNARPWKLTGAGAIARNEAVNALRYPGRALWR